MEVDQEDWYTSVQQELQNEQNRINTLITIRKHLDSVPSNEAVNTANRIDLPLVFDCLNDSNAEQIDLACEVLTMCMVKLNVGESTSKYEGFLERALKHPKPEVKLMSLKQITRCLDIDGGVEIVTREENLLTSIVDCVGDEDLSVAVCAMNIIEMIARKNVDVFAIKAFSDRVRELFRMKDIVRFRGYEMLLNISCFNAKCLLTTMRLDWWDAFMCELQSDDILLQLNALQLLADFLACEHGREFLEGKNIPGYFVGQLPSLKNNPLYSILLPGLLKFFGNLAYWQPQDLLTKYQACLSELLNVDNLNDVMLYGIIVDTIGHITLRNHGKIILNQRDNDMRQILRHLGNTLINVSTEQRIRALNCFENLLQVPVDDQTHQAQEITAKWYNYITTDRSDVIISNAKNPFGDIRIAGLKVLKAMSTQGWGQTVILQAAGLIEYLLDRNENHTKEIKEVKFEINRDLAGSAFVKEVWKEALDKYVADGAFHVELLNEVALDGMAT